MTDAEERWSAIAGFSGQYDVSDVGRVRNRSTGGVLKPFPNDCGYLYISLRKDGRQKNIRVHRLVAEAFIPKSEGRTHINHIDHNKKNNAVSNLEWVTRSENIRAAMAAGRMEHLSWAFRMGEAAGLQKARDVSAVARRKLTDDQVVEIRRIGREGSISQRLLAQKYNTDQGTISRILRGKAYAHVK